MNATTDFNILDTLHDLARDLDLNNEEDRVEFRTRFSAAFKNCTVKALRKYARDLGTSRLGQSRADAERNITYTYILNTQLGHYDGSTVTVTLTRAEAQALHNHALGSVLVSAQDKLRAAMEVSA